MITGLTLETFAKHLHVTGEGFSMFPVVYWAKVSEPAGKVGYKANFSKVPSTLLKL